MAALHGFRHEGVDVDGQDIRHLGITQALLDDLQSELIPIIGRRLHLGTVIRVPDVAPVTQRHGMAAEERHREERVIRGPGAAVLGDRITRHCGTSNKALCLSELLFWNAHILGLLAQVSKTQL